MSKLVLSLLYLESEYEYDYGNSTDAQLLREIDLEIEELKETENIDEITTYSIITTCFIYTYRARHQFENGTLLLDRDNVKIYLTGNYSKSLLGYLDIEIVIENNRKEVIDVYCDSLCLNDWDCSVPMMNSYMSIPSGKKKKATITCDMEGASIHSIDELVNMDVVFSVDKSSTYQKMFTSESVPVYFNTVSGCIDMLAEILLEMVP